MKFICSFNTEFFRTINTFIYNVFIHFCTYSHVKGQIYYPSITEKQEKRGKHI